MSEPELEDEASLGDSDIESPTSSEEETADQAGVKVIEDEDFGAEELVEEEKGEEEEEEEEEPIVYDPNDFISKPFLSEKSTFREDVVKFHHSFGYDCLKLYNLCQVDHNTVAFLSGNYIHFFNVNTSDFRLRRSSGGSGFGFIARHPIEPLLAVGEKGTNPIIIIYVWPTFEVTSVLENGTKREYTYLHFSPDGELLASQGGSPDHMLTIWRWRKNKIILRCKAHGQDIFKAQFSPSIPGHLTSCGIGHIKFWQMSDTFTGKKLQGIVGKFGKTQICDITALYQMADEKVISDCKWGNILIWDAEVIKLEVRRRNNEPCHTEPITWLEYNAKDDELLSVGLDGMFKIWNYTTIDTADPPDDNRVIHMQASYEYEITDKEGHAAIRTIFRRNPKEDPYHFIAQDINGFIWLLDLEVKPKPDRPLRLFRCHSGQVLDMSPSPCDYYLATVGVEGNLHVYNVVKKYLLIYRKFTPNATSLIWLPLKADRTGTLLIVGFRDGTLRGVVASVKAKEQTPTDTSHEYINVIWAIKPHTNAVTNISINTSATIIVSGSDDCTLFVYKIVLFREYLKLLPICQVELPGPVSSLIWKNTVEEPVVLATCINGYAAECQLLSQPEPEPIVSYNFKLPIRLCQFQSIKSETQRTELVLKIKNRKEAKVERKKAEMKKLYADNPGVLINEELYLEDSEEEEELPPLYYPPEPSPIYFARYIDDDHIWISAGAYDIGYMYTYKLGSSYPEKAIPMADADDIELMSCCEIFDGEYLIFGLDGGRIRLVRVNPEDYTDLFDYWEFSVHDPTKGKINRIAPSYDSRMLYTVGEDSNIISYYINLPEGKYGEKKLFPPMLPPPEFGVEDYIAPDALSIEEVKQAVESDIQYKISEQKKDAMRAEISILRAEFKTMLEMNSTLPDIYRIPLSKFSVHPRVQASIDKSINEQKELFKRKTEYNFLKSKLLYEKVHNYFVAPVKVFFFTLSGIKIEDTISSFTTVKVDQDFLEAEQAVQKYLENKARSGRFGKKTVEAQTAAPVPKQIQHKGLVISGLHEVLPLLTPQEMTEYKKFEKYERWRARRQRKWDDFLASKPQSNLSNVIFEEIAGEMRTNEADYKLKTDPNFKIPRSQRVTKEEKYAELLKMQRKIWALKDGFNDKVLGLRQRKVDLVVSMKRMRAELKSIHREIGQKYAKPFPPIPSFNIMKEFPERLLTPNPGVFPPDLPVPKQKLDNEFILLYGRKPWDPKKVIPKTYTPEQLTAIAMGDAEDQLPTAWSEELTQLRKMRLRKKQDMMLYKINRLTENYDNDIIKLKGEKLNYQYKVAMIESQFIVALEELEIIRGYQSLIENSQRKINKNLAEKHVNILKVNIRLKKIEAKEEEMNVCYHHISDVQYEFNDLISNSKYTKHLTKIFKKKYRPPKQSTDDDESESSSSEESSSTESEGGDDESGAEMGAFMFDETICPDDLDPDLFNKVFTLRGTRYIEELKVTAIKREVIVLQKQIDLIKRKLIMFEVIITFQREEVEGFMRQQQEKINKLDILAVLDTSQLQHYDMKKEEFIPEEDCVLFSGMGLNELHKRYGQYKREIETFQKGQKACRSHLKSIKRDMEFMNKEILKVQNQIKNEMKNKFGTVVDLRSMDIHIIKDMLTNRKYEHKMSKMTDSAKNIALKKKVSEARESLLKVKRENTDKLYTTAALLEQTRCQVKLIQDKQMEKEKEKKYSSRIPDEELDANIERLTKIFKEQLAIKESILSEIAMLKMKCVPKYPRPSEQVPVALPGLRMSSTQVAESIVIPDVRKELDETTSGEEVCKGLISSLVKRVLPTTDVSMTDIETGGKEAEDLVREVMLSVVKEVLPTPQTSTDDIDIESTSGELCKTIIQSVIKEVLPTPQSSISDVKVGEEPEHLAEEIMASIVKHVLPTPESSKISVEMSGRKDETENLLSDTNEDENVLKESQEMTEEIFKEVLEDTMKVVFQSDDIPPKDLETDEELEFSDVPVTEDEEDIWSEDEMNEDYLIEEESGNEEHD